MADIKRKIRLTIKLMVVALILAGAGLFILKDKSGRPSKSAESREYTEMYKYKDANGILHYTDIKPKNTEYEVLHMPVSKDKPTVEKTIDKLIGKVFKDKKEKKKEEESQTNASADEKATEASGTPSDHEDLIKEAKETLQKVADLYKDAPEAINEAKKVKQQVEKVYQEREKAMKEMR